MAKKRKVVKSTTQKTKRIKKTIPEPEPEPIEETEQIEEEEEEEEEQVDLEDNDEEEEEEEEDEEDENALTNTNGAGNDGEEEEEEGDDEEEPVSKLLEPFTKEQLIEILQQAADNHEDVLENIRKISDTDPVHRKIFVHGLGWDTNSEILTSVFKKYGEIEECNAVTDKMTGKSKGYAFILFKRRNGARKALKEPQKKIGSRMTACQLASAGPVPNQPVQAHVHAQPVLPAVAVSEYTQRKIYVSNVSADIDPQKLLGFFAKFGEVEEGPLGMDKQTGKPKGFALFVYKSVESAKKALEEPHKSFEGHILHCQKAIDGPKPVKPHFQQHSHGGGRSSKFPQNDKFNYGGGHTSGGVGTAGHLMAQSAGPGMAYNQGASPALNPVLGQALTAFIASQGGGMGLTNLLGTLGPAGAAVNPVAQPMMQGGYSNQYVGTGYASQPGMHGGYSHTQAGQGSSGRSQKGAGHMGGMNPFMGH